ncbi:MAG: thymidine phosphorylase [Verrucomicrobiota bacterium]|jgi:pyrimidine-nucleoside phosphorylase|nr:thymidine phosphorylase [Verrucomicrobiota bacterium]
MNFLPFIETKRDGGELSPEQVRELVDAYTAGKIPDYQMSAFLMSVFFRSMSPDETRALTLAMRDSGVVLQFPEDDRPLVDKHSTGGVGDKVSIVLAPLLACLGFRVPMISGRGLGITGGTLDKLESIPGFTTQLPPARIIEQVQSIGVAMGAQTSEMAPADKALYALRDVTGTVPSIPLITASILSKKLAEGIDALVMDVKFGRAAFMANRDAARELASSITKLAAECKVKATALLSVMDVPLGRAAGNWLEVKESVDCLDGRGPEDLKELVLTCAAELLATTGRTINTTNGRQRAGEELASDRPRRKLDELIAAQDGDVEAFREQLKQDHTAPVVRELISYEEGFIAHCDARVVGEIVRDLGGGRLTKESVMHPSVGVDQLAKPGDALGRQGTLARVHARTEAEAQAALARLKNAFELADEPPELPPLIVAA